MVSNPSPFGARRRDSGAHVGRCIPSLSSSKPLTRVARDAAPAIRRAASTTVARRAASDTIVSLRPGFRTETRMLTKRSKSAVTVAIPTYNRPAFLQETLSSLLAQELQEFQVLVVDDASKCDVGTLVASFRDPRIRVLRQPTNVGMQCNWRTALCTPSTPYVALLEDDNLWLPHHLHEALATLDEYPDATMYGCTSEMFGEEREDQLFKPSWSTGTGVEVWRWQETGYSRWLQGCPVMASSVVLRREALGGLSWGGRTWPWCHDWLWWGQLALRGAVLFNNRVGIRYRWHGSNATHGFQDSRSRAQWLYTIRELAKRAWRAGGLRHLVAETAGFSASALSVLVVALMAPETPRPLRRQALQLFRRRQDIVREPGCAMNFRIAAVIGSWWLCHADLRTRLWGRWWPVATW
jgi:hypothetical protein